MKLEDLKEMGLENELAEKVLNAFKEALKDYVPKSRFDEVNTAKKNAEQLVSQHESQIKELEKATKGNEDLQSQIAKMKQDNETLKTDYENQIKKMAVNHAVESALMAEHARNIKTVLPLLDLEGAEVGEDGQIKGLSDKIKALKESEDTSFLFDTPKPPAGLNSPTPKEGAPDAPAVKPTTYEDFCNLYPME